MIKSDAKILIVTGGTGGHIFPAQELERALRDEGYNNITYAVDKRYLSFNKEGGDNIYIIPSAYHVNNIINIIKTLYIIFKGVCLSSILLFRKKIDIVIGFGGYISFPMMLSAVIFRYKTIIHEQNSVLGKTNRFLLPRIGYLATSFKETFGINEKYKNKIVFTGNLVRKNISDIGLISYPEINLESQINILVIGGSQGASIFSKIVPDAILNLPDNCKERIKLVQQCREHEIEYVQKKYKDANIKFEIKSFFEDMDKRYLECHLVICRAGATSIAELISVGRPAIIIPISNSIYNHQKINADIINNYNGGWILDEKSLQPEKLSEIIVGLLKEPIKLVEAANNMKENSINGSKNLVNLVKNIINMV